MPDLRRQIPDHAALPPAVHGFVSHLGEAPGEPFQIRVPSFDGGDPRIFEIRRWAVEPQSVGDEVLVLIDDRSEPWVIAAWPPP